MLWLVERLAELGVGVGTLTILVSIWNEGKAIREREIRADRAGAVPESNILGNTQTSTSSSK